MLFVLSDNVITAAKEGDHHAIRVINDLCTALRYGRHFMYASRDGLTNIRENDLLDKTAQRVAYGLEQGYAMRYSNLFGRVETYISIEIGTSINVTTDSRGLTCITLPINEIYDDSVFLKCVLLLENSSEKEIYYQMRNFYSAENKYYVSCLFEVRLGGGNTTAKVFKDVVDDRRLCLCICDSDKTYPSCPLGSTARGIISFKTNHWPLCEVFTTDPFREVENLIPFYLLLTLSTDNANLLRPCQEYQSIVACNEEAYRYIDVKLGLNLKKFRNLDNDTFSFIQNLMVKSGIKTSSEVAFLCGLPDTDVDSRKEELILSCCSSHILDEYNSTYGSSPISRANLTADQYSKWFYIGKQLYNWGYALGVIV